jgi:small basic protein
MENFTEEEKKRFEGYIKLYVDDDVTEVQGRIEALQKRDQKLWFYLLANVVAVFLFASSYFMGDSHMGNTLYIILLVVFGINVLVIFYQKSQIRKTIKYVQDSE